MAGLHLLRSPRALALAALVLGGCVSGPHADLMSDTYAATDGNAPGMEPGAWRPDARLVLDMDAAAATFTIDGAEQRFALDEQDTQVNGCDGNAREDWVRIDASTLTIEGVTFRSPVLIAECPGDPRRVVLTEGIGEPPFGSEGTPMIAFEPR